MKKIMVIGAGPLQLPLIKKIQELGHYSISIDRNPKSIGFKFSNDYKVIDIVNSNQCLEYAKEAKIDGVITAATDYGVLTTSYIAQKLDLPGLKMSVAETVKNKFRVRELLNEKGVDLIPDFYEIKNYKELELIQDKISYPVIVKPTDGSGSNGVSKVTNPRHLKNAAEEAMNLSLTKKVYIESFITGQEYGVESFVYNEEVYILGIMKKLMTENPIFAELGHESYPGLSQHIINLIDIQVRKAIKAIGINYGSVNMDVIIKEDHVKIIDIGARMGGNLIGSHIIPLSTGVDLLGTIVKASIGEEINLNTSNEFSVATRLLDFTPGVVNKIGDFTNLFEDKDIADIIINIKEGDIINKYKSNKDSCGYIVVKNKNPIEASRKAALVRADLEKYFEIKQIN